MVKNNLLSIRLQMGYKKQKDFAEYLGMDSKHYSKLENNKYQANIETILKMCKKLNMNVEDVFILDHQEGNK